MKLPGELRNQIYELVLPVDTVIEIRSRRKPSNRCQMVIEPAKMLRWAEPALLQVSRQIRAECVGLYYGDNHFKLFARSKELQQVLDFLLLKSAGEATNINLSFNIHMVDVAWTDMKYWLPMAKIAYYKGGDVHNALDGRIARANWARSSYIDGAIQEVIKLGLKAKRRGLDLVDVRDDFADWAASMIRAFGSGRRCLSQLTRDSTGFLGGNVV